MKITYVILIVSVFLVLLTPAYVERHALTNTLHASVRDCYTGLTGQTVCTEQDTAAFIGFAALALVAGCLLFLTSIALTYPLARRYGLI